jgi:GTP-binding protein Era
MHKAGFVNIIGLPNVGKSTLMNQLVGERMSIISPKAQTTRHRILGFVNGEDYQIVFSDTPGYIGQPAYKLQASMNTFVADAFTDADVILFVTDKFQSEEELKPLLENINKTEVPVIVAINKLDLYGKQELEDLVAQWKLKVPKADVITLSASSGINSKKLINKLVALLPESPPYYDKEELTDRNVRFFVAEIVREKIFLHYTHEVPYSCEVVVDTYSEEEKIDKIKCNIYVERESQKSILIGKKGASLKQVGIDARKDIEAFVSKQVYLELFVKIREKWRNNDSSLKHFGYKN